MARIPLMNGFVRIPEGWHTFKVESVEYDEDFGKLSINLVTSKGLKYTERFKLMGNNGEWNDKALNAFSYMAKVILNRFDVEEGQDIDPEELVGHFLRLEIKHTQTESTKEPGKMVTFVNSGDKEPASGFDDVPAEAPKAAAKPSWLK